LVLIFNFDQSLVFAIEMRILTIEIVVWSGSSGFQVAIVDSPMDLDTLSLALPSIELMRIFWEIREFIFYYYPCIWYVEVVDIDFDWQILQHQIYDGEWYAKLNYNHC